MNVFIAVFALVLTFNLSGVGRRASACRRAGAYVGERAGVGAKADAGKITPENDSDATGNYLKKRLYN